MAWPTVTVAMTTASVSRRDVRRWAGTRIRREMVRQIGHRSRGCRRRIGMPRRLSLVTVGLAIVYYLVVRAVKRGRGVDLDLAYAEIPPE